MQEIPPKRCHLYTSLQGVIRQETGIFIGTTLRISYLVQYTSDIQRATFKKNRTFSNGVE